ncbi:DNA methyltransferase [Tumebacillus flagellatus]|uniref:Methyltransferase n=1 Tax=Tumebacillus flagellatus TaxID=1157490 RepID=A0A074LS36_9BACL|nr:DNA methyltransferase [Tumebacillus flagellatus]KEO84961.1 DNA methylase [Tumebacillus flagellatus]
MGQAARDHDIDWKQLLLERQNDSWNRIREIGVGQRHHLSDGATYVLADAIRWVNELPPESIHAVVTDPPYGLIEYEDKHHDKLKSGSGGVWRIPPSFDGAKRSPLPRFTVLSQDEIAELYSFFNALAYGLKQALVPGGHIFVASNPLLSSWTFHAFTQAGLEKRGEVIRLVQTLRGGDRPKGAEQEFFDVSVMARSCWEPWGIFRKPFNGTVAENLRRYGTGGLRRISDTEPFKDVIQCSPTRKTEKEIAPHPSLKPQRFLRQLVRASLPLGIGIVYDPFAGSGSTLAAAEAVGYRAIGTDRDGEYFELAKQAFEPLSKMVVKEK